jgi:hypothetical protein
MLTLWHARGVRINDVFAARAVIANSERRARAWAVVLRTAPPEPTTCCGRGCNGCVWEGYFDAVQYWLEDAQAMFDASASGEGCTSAAD